MEDIQNFDIILMKIDGDKYNQIMLAINGSLLGLKDELIFWDLGMDNDKLFMGIERYTPYHKFKYAQYADLYRLKKPINSEIVLKNLQKIKKLYEHSKDHNWRYPFHYIHNTLNKITCHLFEGKSKSPAIILGDILKLIGCLNDDVKTGELEINHIIDISSCTTYNKDHILDEIYEKVKNILND